MKIYELYIQNKEATFRPKARLPKDEQYQYPFHFHRSPRGFVEVRDAGNAHIYLNASTEVEICDAIPATAS